MDLYQQGFETFLSHTDEKKVLAQTILSIIKKQKVRSLLDLGAGNGELAALISENVPNYLAVEPKPQFVQKLRAHGLEVIESNFPCSVKGEYDLVLISHVLSRKQHLWEPFLTEAWKVVAKGGSLLIVTYRVEQDDWSDLMDYLELPQLEENQEAYKGMIEFLEGRGGVSMSKVITHVTTSRLEEMVAALSFVAGNGIPEQTRAFLQKQDTLEKYLQEHYRTEGGYRFPFYHYCIQCQKPS